MTSLKLNLINFDQSSQVEKQKKFVIKKIKPNNNISDNYTPIDEILDEDDNKA